ncbi:MAG: DNA polymerase III subunit beta [Flavobacteriaceae bacterium]|tara:strand:- start:2623 stop:3747 length:1125 start_codon:yes stop_codon:yes gene_type:complete
MKFIVSSHGLLKKLQILLEVVNATNTLPILDNFLFQINKNSLKVTSSDLETTMSTTLEIESESSGEIAVPARLLVDALKNFAEQPLTFSSQEDSVLEINANDGKYRISFVSAEEYPKPIEIKDSTLTSLKGGILSKAINSTIFATGNDDLRPVMSGVFFQFTTKNISLVGTDAHKLVRYIRNDIKSDGNSEFIMPKKALQVLKKTILTDSENDVSIEYNETNAKFIFENYSLSCRLIEGKYPNYEAVIPKQNPNKLIIERILLLNSVKRVGIFSNKSTNQIKFKIAGSELNISAEDYDYNNKAEERISCNYNGDDIEIGFNSRFLTDMLNNLDCDEICLSMSLPNKAGIITPTNKNNNEEEITMLLMPVMLNSD